MDLRRWLLGFAGMSMLFVGTCVMDDVAKLSPLCRYGQSQHMFGVCEPGWIVELNDIECDGRL